MPFDRQSGVADDAVTLLVPSMSCAGCLIKIERHLMGLRGVRHARANLSTRSVQVRTGFEGPDTETLIEALACAGYQARPFDPAIDENLQADRAGRDLLLRLGIAGFAAMNVMLLSVSIWSGADAATRDLLHWISGLVALPAVAYSGQPFFRGAVAALKMRRLNMDVPISLAVILASVHSVLEAARGADHAYFDAAIMLVFFLLIGRYLEHRTRQIARSAASELLALTGRTARRILPDGTRQTLPLDALDVGMEIEIAPGERIPSDGTIMKGQTDLDRALVTGENNPEPAGPGETVYAGMLNISGAIRVEVIATGDAMLLAEVARMVDASARGRGRYDRIADRAARIYAPLVHVLALAAFVGWYTATGNGHLAVQVAVAVLIVTCPCALALAVPTVHTVISSRLFRQGIYLKDGAELERLAEIDMVAFDKTGTLTDGAPRLICPPDADDDVWPIAAGLAVNSRHPFAQAIAARARDLGVVPAKVDSVREVPGLGIEGQTEGGAVRLGRQLGSAEERSSTTLSMPGRTQRFEFAEALRPGAAQTCATLCRRGLQVAVLSGDTQAATDRIAGEVGLTEAFGAMRPDEKCAWLGVRRVEGRKVLMVGDGLNDAPALAGAHASMSPASASDAAKVSAGLVFTGASLEALVAAHDAALTARSRAFQSLAIAAAYNAIAIPLALGGFVTPLIAAAAMSGSSILVMLNAVRPTRST